MADEDQNQTTNQPQNNVTSIPEHENSNSPLFLHHSDNSLSGAITPLLNLSNYHTWSRIFLMQLSIRNKLGFIHGTVPIPTNPDSKEAWKRCNTIILSWMMNSVSPDIKSALYYAKTAAEGWQKLKMRYAQPNDVRIFQLQKEIMVTKQGHSSVTDFFTKLSALWEELDDYRPIPHGLCENETCKVCEEVEKTREVDKIFKFLMSLTDAYDMVSGQILLMKPKPSLDVAYSMVLQEE